MGGASGAAGSLSEVTGGDSLRDYGADLAGAGQRVGVGVT